MEEAFFQASEHNKKKKGGGEEKYGGNLGKWQQAMKYKGEMTIKSAADHLTALQEASLATWQLLWHRVLLAVGRYFELPLQWVIFTVYLKKPDMKRFLLARGSSAGERAAQLDFKKGFIVGKVVLPDKTEACRFHLHPESKSSTVLQKKEKRVYLLLNHKSWLMKIC